MGYVLRVMGAVCRFFFFFISLERMENPMAVACFGLFGSVLDLLQIVGMEGCKLGKYDGQMTSRRCRISFHCE